MILKDQDKIELQFCHDSGEFSPDVDLTHLTENGKNLIPKMEPLEPSYLEPSIENIIERLDDDEMLPGAYRDEHDCIPSAGYEWSETKQECVRPWLQEENISQITDEALHETGLIKAVEDGVYPIHSVTIELPKAHLTQTFSLNVEAADINQAALGKAVGQHVSFD